jgi:hypothetical protein
VDDRLQRPLLLNRLVSVSQVQVRSGKVVPVCRHARCAYHDALSLVSRPQRTPELDSSALSTVNIVDKPSQFAVKEYQECQAMEQDLDRSYQLKLKTDFQ